MHAGLVEERGSKGRAVRPGLGRKERDMEWSINL
jgi:hypothetical protein